MTLVAIEFMSLDGVVQAPSYSNEDSSGGFKHGGWHRPFLDNVSMQWVVDTIAGAEGYLLGRTTYDSFAAHWPNAGPDESVLAEPLNTKPKYLVTSHPLDATWANTKVLRGDLKASISELMSVVNGKILIIGSPILARSLLELELIDELRVMIDPIVIGSGKRLFGEYPRPITLKLASCVPCDTGSLLATYLKP